MSASPSLNSTAATMSTQEKPNDFGYRYMPHYQHYAAVLEAGGLKLSSPEQRYLIGLIRRETRTASKVTSQAQGRRSSKHNIVHPPSRRPQAVPIKHSEDSRFFGLRTTAQEEDLLRSLLGSREVEADQVSNRPNQSLASDHSSHDIQTAKVRHDPGPVSSGHAAIIVPFSPDEDRKPYCGSDD